VLLRIENELERSENGSERRRSMATLSTIPRIGVLRLALTGAFASALFFVLCWLGAQLQLGTLSHMYIQLFTKAPVSSAYALIEGFCWSVAFGLIGGALIAWAYNLLGTLERM
jgi:hypothetical protein